MSKLLFGTKYVLKRVSFGIWVWAGGSDFRLYDGSNLKTILCLLCPCARLVICSLWSPAEKGLTSWLSFVVSNCEFVTFPLVSWVRCGT